MTLRPSLRAHEVCLQVLLAIGCALPGGAQDNTRKLLKKVDAQYPSELKRHGIGGVVRLKVYIKPDGSVRTSEVVGGGAALADAAQKAVAQWRFAPAPAETTMDVSVVFDPNSQP